LSYTDYTTHLAFQTVRPSLLPFATESKTEDGMYGNIREFISFAIETVPSPKRNQDCARLILQANYLVPEIANSSQILVSQAIRKGNCLLLARAR
jgi:hypothetical protein